MPASSQKIGIFGEKIAKDFLIRKGYAILHQNLKISYKELDLIAKKAGQTVFVEVKTRNLNNYPEAEESLSRRQLQTLKKGVKNYCFANKINLKNIRIDLIAINILKPKNKVNIKHFKNII